MSSFFLTLVELFKTQEKFINLIMGNYSLLRGTIWEGIHWQRSVRERTLQERIFREGNVWVGNVQGRKVRVGIFWEGNAWGGAARR